MASSSLPDSGRFGDFASPRTWDAALSLLASALPTDTPSIVILDEMPCLVREDPTFEGALQKAFDRALSKLPVLLVLIGSDIAMMERLNTYGQPFYERGTEMVVLPRSLRPMSQPCSTFHRPMPSMPTSSRADSP